MSKVSGQKALYTDTYNPLWLLHFPNTPTYIPILCNFGNSVIAVFLLLHYLAFIISLHVQLVNLCIHIITTGKCASQGFTVDNM